MSPTNERTRVFLNAHVYTVDAGHPWATAFAVRDGEFLVVGSAEDVAPYLEQGAEVFDLNGQFVMPGLVESHVHVMLGAAVTSGLTFDMTDSTEQVLSKVSEAARAQPGETIFGSGYNGLMFGDAGPSAALIDALVPDQPVVLLDHTLHGGWANSRALENAVVNAQTADPLPGRYGRDASGAPTGALRGGAASLPVLVANSAIRPEAVTAALVPILNAMTAYGFTAALDCGNIFDPDATLDALAALEQSNQLPLRVSLTSFVYSPTALDECMERQQRMVERFDSQRLWADTVKLLADSVIENQTAAVFEPYESTHERGELYFSHEQFRVAVERARSLNQAIIVHAIGDRAVHECLNAAEELRVAGDDVRFIITHVQMVAPDDRARFGDLGVIVQTTANWANYQPGYIEHLGQARNDSIQFPFRSWVDSGAIVALGADWPATPGGLEYGMNPWVNISTALQRKIPTPLIEQFGSADRVLEPAHEVLTLAEAIESYTLSGAKALGRHDVLGSIAVGKRADFVVLDRNPFETEVTELWRTTVRSTFVDGEETYRSA